MKWYAVFLVLLLALLTTSCVSEEVKNEYARAKVDRIEAETAALEQKRQQDHLSWEAAEARRAESETESRQTRRVLAYIVTTGAVAGGLVWAISGAFQVWVNNRVGLFEAAEKEAQAKAQATKEECRAQETRVAAFREKRLLIEAEAERLKQEQLLLKIRASDNGHSQQPVASKN
jgi:hypothetical protein